MEDVQYLTDGPTSDDCGDLATRSAGASEAVEDDTVAHDAGCPAADVGGSQSSERTATRAVAIPRGTVVLAATPIGNVAYHDHNEREKADGLLDRVEAGATVLVVSDAGMPTINDPGLAVVRRAIERGLPVTCAPGPSAVLDALALSGLPTDRFCYEGFLPRKHSERVQYLRTMRVERRTMVFYETLHRIDESMADLLEAFGPDRPMALCRELTKEYEQVRRGTIGEIRQSVVDDPPRGEMVLVVGGASETDVQAAAPASLSVADLAVLAVDRALEDGLRIKDAIMQVVEEHPLPDGSLANRKQVYAAVLAMKS